MQKPAHINTLFKDFNGDSVKIKLKTAPFISGSVDDIVNWMISNPIGNIDMEDLTTGITLFFLACRYNPNDEVITWLIETGETKLDFINSKKENIIEYLAKTEFNSPRISSRIILLLKYILFDVNYKNYFGDTFLDIFCYSGYVDVIDHVVKKEIKFSPDKISELIVKVNQIITGECDDYWTTDDVNEQYFFKSLENVIKYLETLR